jgi:hypothetical protein
MTSIGEYVIGIAKELLRVWLSQKLLFVCCYIGQLRYTNIRRYQYDSS